MDKNKVFSNFISEADDDDDDGKEILLPLAKKLKLDTITEEKKTTNTPEKANEEFEYSIDIYQSILEALKSWSSKILDYESMRESKPSFRYAINISIRRLEIDGFLSLFEANELRYISEIWMELLQLVLNYDKDYDIKMKIIRLMVELYDLKQLSTHIFINCLMKL